jgi:hypothetical protein
MHIDLLGEATFTIDFLCFIIVNRDRDGDGDGNGDR